MKPVMNVKKIKYREPSEATKKQILAASGNQCAFPTCARIIVDREHNVIVGKIAHIKARSAGRITFPIYDINGKIHGFMGRRPDNRGTHWIKQQYRKRKIKETDSTLAEWLQTSRPTIIKYKGTIPMFEEIRDRAMKVSPFRLHSEVFLFMIDCTVKWLVSQEIIKKKKE
ncbi:MAG: hypothetical protein U9N47_00005 [Thermodesulfobacteriota bacterium]|nr:hypothetical protein [Thermodesulfobacteriota bacterium]